MHTYIHTYITYQPTNQPTNQPNPTQPNPTQPNPTQPNQQPNQQPNPTQPNPTHPPTHQPTNIHTDRQVFIHFFLRPFVTFVALRWKWVKNQVGSRSGQCSLSGSSVGLLFQFHGWMDCFARDDFYAATVWSNKLIWLINLFHLGGSPIRYPSWLTHVLQGWKTTAAAVCSALIICALLNWIGSLINGLVG